MGKWVGKLDNSYCDQENKSNKPVGAKKAGEEEKKGREKVGDCLLKFCNYGLYKKLLDGKYLLPEKNTLLKNLVDVLEGTETQSTCIIFGILGSAKSAVLNQCKDELKSKRNTDVAYIDLNEFASKIWQAYNKKPEKYMKQPCDDKGNNKTEVKLIEECIFQEIKKQWRHNKLIYDCESFEKLIEKLRNIEDNNGIKRQVILIDNLDNLPIKILKDNCKYEDLNTIIVRLKVIVQHLYRFYDTISKLHYHLNKKKFGGCLVTARKEMSLIKKIDNDLPRLSENLFHDIDEFWYTNTDALVDIFIYYISNNKKSAHKCINHCNNCNECNYLLTLEQVQYCEKQKKRDPNDEIFLEIKNKILHHIQISDYNLKKFLFPFAHVAEDMCVMTEEKGKNKKSINQKLKGYYSGIENDPRLNTRPRPDGSIMRTYLDWFPILYYSNYNKYLLGESRVLEGEEKIGAIEQFIINNRNKELSEKDWIELIRKDVFNDAKSKQKNESSKFIFAYLKLCGALLKKGNDYSLSEFLKFVYDKDNKINLFT